MKKLNLKTLTKEQKHLRKRILEVSFEKGLSHLGSCLSAVDLINEIYRAKRKDDIFVLSNGHAGVALYIILEKYGYIKNSTIIKQLHVHPDRNIAIGIHVSTGSLGQGLPIALGMAIADKKRIIYAMVSDGECSEGSIWETVRFASDAKITNLKIILNANGWSAYDRINIKNLKKRFKSFGYTVIKLHGHDPKNISRAIRKDDHREPTLFFAHTTVEQFPFLKGQDAHYYIMNEKDYLFAIESLL